MKILILYSGGLDSMIMDRFAAVYHPNDYVHCVFYDIGQPYVDKERTALPDHVEQVKLGFSMKEYSKSDGKSLSGGIFIPGRNLALATLAACQYLPDEIWLGALLGETHAEATDKNFKFAHDSSELLSYVLGPFLDPMKPRTKIRLPLAEYGLNKLTATAWALENGISKETLMATSSCLSGEEGNCGQCIVCLRRWGIFKQLGFEEHYNIHPLSVPHNLEIIEKLKTGTNYDRQVEILPALGIAVNRPRISRKPQDFYQQGF